MQQYDLLTGEVFYPSRITQKFARSENRIKYHNIKANQLRHSIMFVNSPLQKNLRILIEIMEGKSTGVFHKQFLLGKGFSFDVLTHYDDFDGLQMPCIFHFACQVNDNDEVIFHRVQNKKND